MLWENIQWAAGLSNKGSSHGNSSLGGFLQHYSRPLGFRLNTRELAHQSIGLRKKCGQNSKHLKPRWKKSILGISCFSIIVYCQKKQKAEHDFGGMWFEHWKVGLSDIQTASQWNLAPCCFNHIIKWWVDVRALLLKLVGCDTSNYHNLLYKRYWWSTIELPQINISPPHPILKFLVCSTTSIKAQLSASNNTFTVIKQSLVNNKYLFTCFALWLRLHFSLPFIYHFQDHMVNIW